MPRQNFIARESFVDATEKQTKDSLLSIPAFAPNIRLLAENKMNESIRFLYELPATRVCYHIDASVLPLNREYTRISLHGRYASGQAFNHDNDLASVLLDFEAAVKAALRGDVSLYTPYAPRPANTKKFLHYTLTLATAVGMLFLRKKLS